MTRASILGVVDISDEDLTNREPLSNSGKPVYRDFVFNLRNELTQRDVPAEALKGVKRAGMPDCQDNDWDGYPRIER